MARGGEGPFLPACHPEGGPTGGCPGVRQQADRGPPRQPPGTGRARASDPSRRRPHALPSFGGRGCRGGGGPRGAAAVLVPPGGEDALAEALDGLVEGGPDVERRRGRGVERAAAYTWEASAAAHVEVYRSVL